MRDVIRTVSRCFVVSDFKIIFADRKQTPSARHVDTWVYAVWRRGELWHNQL